MYRSSSRSSAVWMSSPSNQTLRTIESVTRLDEDKLLDHVVAEASTWARSASVSPRTATTLLWVGHRRVDRAVDRRLPVVAVERRRHEFGIGSRSAPGDIVTRVRSIDSNDSSRSASESVVDRDGARRPSARRTTSSPRSMVPTRRRRVDGRCSHEFVESRSCCVELVEVEVVPVRDPVAVGGDDREDVPRHVSEVLPGVDRVAVQERRIGPSDRLCSDRRRCTVEAVDDTAPIRATRRRSSCRARAVDGRPR